MGSASGYICEACGARFVASGGGGFYFDLLHCDQCGRDRSVGHQDMGDIHLGFVKGLRGSYAVSRSRLDEQIKATYEGTPLSRDEYHAAVEATLDPCDCGGRFRYDAPARCPQCRSTEEQWEWDQTVASVLYD